MTVRAWALPLFLALFLAGCGLFDPPDQSAVRVSLDLAGTPAAGEVSLLRVELDPSKGPTLSKEAEVTANSTATVSFTGIEPGTVDITVELSDDDGTVLYKGVGSATAVAGKTVAAPIAVKAPPTVDITAPAQGDSVEAGTTVSFTGAVDDPGPVTVAWTSNQQGTLSTELSFERNDLVSGSHLITLTATDSLGLEASDAISMWIVSADTLAALRILVDLAAIENSNELALMRVVLTPESGPTLADESPISGDTASVRFEGLDAGDFGVSAQLLDTDNSIAYAGEGTATAIAGSTTDAWIQVESVVPDTIQVPGPGSLTIQEAIDQVADGGTIVLEPQEFVLSQSLEFQGKPLTLTSTDPDDPDVVAATEISGNLNHTVLLFQNGEGNSTVVRGITIKGGRGGVGAGVYCNGASPTLDRCVIRDNRATLQGGGVYCGDGSSARLNDCTIIDNFSTAEDSSLAVGGAGVCIENSGGVEISGGTVTNNTSATSGGGILLLGSSAVINGVTLTGNIATGTGGGILCRAGSAATITNTAVSGNQASHGGGIACTAGSDALITQCDVSANEAAIWGGGIYSQASSPRIEYSDISSNEVPAIGTNWVGGAGIALMDTLTSLPVTRSNPVIFECTVSFNTSGHSGGGILSSFSNTTIDKCTVNNNLSGSVAGGVEYFNSSSGTVSNSLIFKNETGSFGGGVYVDSLDVENHPSLVVQFKNNLISSNKTTGSPTTGGGIHVRRDARVFLLNCTFTANMTSSANGGGIFAQDGLREATSLTILSSILWNNEGPEIVLDGAVDTAVSHSDIEGGYAGGREIIDADPEFVTWGQFENFLGPGSPCIDTGDPNVTDCTDWGLGTAACDMGAYGGPDNCDGVGRSG